MTVVFGDTPVTGRMLKALREAADLSIREIERRAGGTLAVSNAHLSRVEQGTRAVTHAVVAVYERAVGIRIDADVLRELEERARPGGGGRQEFGSTTALAMVAAGGLREEHERRLLYQAAGTLSGGLIQQRVGDTEAAHIEHLARQVRSLDLRYGGQLASQLVGQLLRWAVGLRGATMTEQVKRRLQVAAGALAQGAAWCAFDTDLHETGLSLSRVALGSAVRADEPDLRSHVLVDVAAQQAQLGNVADAWQLVRLAEEEQRTGPAVRCMLHGARARLYAALGERDRCRREIRLVEQVGAQVEPEAVPGWLGGWEPAHAEAVCGHAYARLAEASGDAADEAEAHKRLATAAEELTVAGRVRAAVLCLSELARMHQRCGNPDEAQDWAEHAQRLAVDLRSTRVSRELVAVKAPHNGGSDAHRREQGSGGREWQ